MPTVVDNLTSNGFVDALGEPTTTYFAQVFRAAGSALNSVEFAIDTTAGPDATKYRVLIVTADTSGDVLTPGVVLFESGVLTDPYDAEDSFTIVKVDTSKVALTPGVQYAFILDAFSTIDGSNSQAKLASSLTADVGVNYADGFFAYFQAASGTRAEHFANVWDVLPDYEMAFRLTFSNPGVTITGTKGKNTVDATHTVKNQQLPTANDDFISGRANRDKLSGLGGDDTLDGGKGNDILHGGEGNDLLIGGRGKDKYFGEAGFDVFLFNTKLHGKPDKLTDFVTADDTIQLSRKVFKVFTEGPLMAENFNAGGKQDKDDHILYRNGTLSYDKDGKGGGDPVVFANLVSKPVLTEQDFVIVA